MTASGRFGNAPLEFTGLRDGHAVEGHNRDVPWVGYVIKTSQAVQRIEAPA
jgi:hypothetical protein